MSPTDVPGRYHLKKLTVAVSWTIPPFRRSLIFIISVLGKSVSASAQRVLRNFAAMRSVFIKSYFMAP